MFKFQFSNQTFIVRLSDIRAVYTLMPKNISNSSRFGIEIHWRGLEQPTSFFLDEKETRDDIFLKLSNALENS